MKMLFKSLFEFNSFHLSLHTSKKWMSVRRDYTLKIITKFVNKKSVIENKC